MVSEKDKKPKVVSIKPETKEAKFLRIAKVRTQKTLKAIRLLGNCSNRANYSYSIEQANKLIEAIYDAVNNMANLFTKSKVEQEAFEF